MTVSDWLSQAQQKLIKTGVETARLDCLVILEDITSRNRAYILAHPDLLLTEVDLKKLNLLVNKRVEHLPLAYIRGKVEFYGRDFVVNKRVLIPRPESENIIDLLKTIYEANQLNGPIIDVGTGSGALAITAKLEIPAATVIGADIDPDCLVVARKNTTKLNAKVKFYLGDLLNPIQDIIQQQDSFILANLPYVPNDYPINRAAQHEPPNALFAGPEGLDLYRRLFGQLNRVNSRVKYVFTEALPDQHEKMTKIAASARYELEESQDFIQIFRQKV